MHVRREALGGKLLTSLAAPVRHTCRHQRGQSLSAAAFRGFRRDVALLAGGSPITLSNGFGRIISYTSGRWHQLYAVNYTKDSLEPPRNRSCSADEYERGRTTFYFYM